MTVSVTAAGSMKSCQVDENVVFSLKNKNT